MEPMIKDLYQQLKVLGRGSYGCVRLMRSKQDKKIYAMKEIQKKKMRDKDGQYLAGEIKCMRQIKSENVVQLFFCVTGDKFHYLFLQYCNGGDLKGQQMKKPGQVYSLEQATFILAQILYGVEQIQKADYLHRDIKAQNIFIKNQNGKKIYKLGGFDFSRKKDEVQGTILGTKNYMSPQVHEANFQVKYGFQVDMWALGVLFFFMLTNKFPFKIYDSLTSIEKAQNLRFQVLQCHYVNYLGLEECTPDVQNLFKQMFQINRAKRINFIDIRKHPVLAKHFQTESKISTAFYTKQLQEDALKIQYLIKNNLFEIINEDSYEDNQTKDNRTMFLNTQKQSPEMQILEYKKSQIDLLTLIQQDLYLSNDLQSYEKFMVCYNLIKYYVILMREFQDSLDAKKLIKIYPGLKWDQLVKTSIFKDFLYRVNDDLNHYEHYFLNLYNQCLLYTEQIKQANQSFWPIFRKDIIETTFYGNFKDSFRKSTSHIFYKLRSKLQNQKNNKISYLLAINLIIHGWNQIFTDKQKLETIFKDYFKQEEIYDSKIYGSHLRYWMSKKEKAILDRIGKYIILYYFNELQ